MDLSHVSFFVIDAITYVRDRSDYVHVKFAAEAFLNDFHMEQAEESAAETESEGNGAFRLEGQRGIIELELFKRGAEVFKVFSLNWVDSGKDHRLDFLEALNGLFTGAIDMGNSVAHFDFLAGFDSGDDISYVAGGNFLSGLHVKAENTDFVGVIFLAGADEFDEVAGAERQGHRRGRGYAQ